MNTRTQVITMPQAPARTPVWQPQREAHPISPYDYPDIGFTSEQDIALMVAEGLGEISLIDFHVRQNTGTVFVVDVTLPRRQDPRLAIFGWNFFGLQSFMAQSMRTLHDLTLNVILYPEHYAQGYYKRVKEVLRPVVTAIERARDECKPVPPYNDVKLWCRWWLSNAAQPVKFQPELAQRLKPSAPASPRHLRVPVDVYDEGGNLMFQIP